MPILSETGGNGEANNYGNGRCSWFCSGYVGNGIFQPIKERESIKSFLGNVAKGAAEYVDAEKSTLLIVGKDESELAVVNAEIVETKGPKIEHAVEARLGAGDQDAWEHFMYDENYNELYELRALLKNKKGKIIGIIRTMKKDGMFMKYDKYLLDNYANKVVIPIVEDIINRTT